MFSVYTKEKNFDYEYIFTDKIELPNGKTIVVDNSTGLTSNYVIHLSSSEIKLPFHVRNKRKGDKMIIKNTNGKRSISNIFTDFKLNKELRDSYPIVTDDTGEIIWIPGIKKSHLDRKKAEKYDIILKYKKKRKNMDNRMIKRSLISYLLLFAVIAAVVLFMNTLNTRVNKLSYSGNCSSS